MLHCTPQGVFHPEVPTCVPGQCCCLHCWNVCCSIMFVLSRNKLWIFIQDMERKILQGIWAEWWWQCQCWDKCYSEAFCVGFDPTQKDKNTKQCGCGANFGNCFDLCAPKFCNTRGITVLGKHSAAQKVAPKGQTAYTGILVCIEPKNEQKHDRGFQDFWKCVIPPTPDHLSKKCVFKFVLSERGIPATSAGHTMDSPRRLPSFWWLIGECWLAKAKINATAQSERISSTSKLHVFSRSNTAFRNLGIRNVQLERPDHNLENRLENSAPRAKNGLIRCVLLLHIFTFRADFGICTAGYTASCLCTGLSWTWLSNTRFSGGCLDRCFFLK